MVLRDQTHKFVIMIGWKELLSVKHPTRKAGPYQSLWVCRARMNSLGIMFRHLICCGIP